MNLIKWFFCLLTIFIFHIQTAFAQVETLSTGSFIVNMGATPQTIANGLKPYGLVYDLVRNYSVPVRWVIAAGKVKDGVDFSYNGTQFKGGTFIIPAEYRTTAVNSRITYWTGQGVVGTTTTNALAINVTSIIKSYPRWTLDATNGAIAQGYLNNAGITLTAFPNAYNWKTPQTLDCCDDFYVMPHADPTWATHGNLYTWNKNCLGSIWAACHAVSALENSINPSNAAEQMNFLSTRTNATTPTPWPNNSLTLFSSHSGGSIPYTHQFFDDPIAQYLGVTDAAQLNGSEQIYLPKQDASPNNTRWRPGAKIIAYDPTQANVLTPDLANGNVAALIVYGRGFDDPDRGYVMYEAGHSHNKGTAGDVAAQRAFFNFSFFQILPKAPNITTTGITTGQNINSGASVPVSASASSPLTGVTFTYLWSSSCGGTFANSTAASTTFTAPTVASPTPCTVTCKVSDNCGRTSFLSYSITILSGPQPPVANSDAASIDVTCGVGTAITTNVLTNDTDPGGLPLTLTNVTGASNGTVSFTANGNVTFTPDANFTGPLTLTYTVCNNATPTALCATNGQYTITAAGASTPSTANDTYTIAEDNIGRFNVLSNDAASLTVMGITSGPSNGKVSINIDNTITYLPNADFNGTDNFTYKVVNASGGTNTATVSITVTNDACDGGTYQAGSGSPSIVSGNDWSHVGTNTAGGNPASSTWSYPIASGSNRVLVVGVEVSVSAANTAPSTKTVTWGGKPLTFLSTNPSTGNRVFAYLYYLNEADIASASGNNLVVTMGGSNIYGFVTLAAVYQYVDQTTIVRNGVSLASSGTASTTASLSTANFTAGDKGIFIAGFGLNSATSTAYSSTVTGWTGSSSLFAGGTGNSGAFYAGIATRNATTAATNETTSMTVTVAQRTSMSVVSLIPGSSCTTIPTRSPLSMPDSASTVNGVAVNIPTATNDYYPVAGSKTYSIITAPISGTATINGTSGVVNYTPATTYNGVRFLTYRVLDNTSGLADTATVYINITDAPVLANNDSPAGALSGTSQTINVLSNDTDPDAASLTSPSYSVSIVSQPINGTATVNGSGNVVYTPNTGYTGADSLVYQVCEPSPSCGSSNCDSATLKLTVTNRVPTAINDTKDILPCLANTINLITNDTDPENGILSVSNLSALSTPSAGALVNNNDGTVTFTPSTGYSGSVTFTYTVTDDGVTPLTSTPAATVTINVTNPVNSSPLPARDSSTLYIDEVNYSSVLDNDTDPENNTLTNPNITIQPLHGTATVLANGLIQYTPSTGYSGADSLTYEICDIINDPTTCVTSNSLCNTTKVIYSIIPPFDPLLSASSIMLSTISGGDGLVKLNWITITENNTSNFEIERSFDDRRFSVVGSMPAAGTSVGQLRYSSTDQINGLSSNGVIYYRIKLYDRDGSYKYSNISAVRINGASIKVWPNPFSDYLQISYNSNTNSTINIRLVDVLGKLVHTQKAIVLKGNNQLEIVDINKLSKGTYLIEIADLNGKYNEVFKVVKIK